MEAKRLKKMMEDSRNGMPKDGNGVPIKMGRVAEAKVNIAPKKIVLNGKTVFLGPKVTKICGKIIIVGSTVSTIRPEQEFLKEVRVKNEDIFIIA